MTTKELTAPPIVEIGFYEGDPDPTENHYIEGSRTGPEHPQGFYIVQGREMKPDGSDWLTLSFSVAEPEADSFFAAPQKQPFRVPASKIRYTRQVTLYSDFIYTPWEPGLAQGWRRVVASIFGGEAAEAEFTRLQSIGHEQWAAERTALLEAGLIPN